MKKRKIHKIYDIILKMIMLVYAEEFLRMIGEERSIKKVLNTEIVTSKGRYLYLDFLCMLDDGTLLNIEFQFTATRPIDLSRFFDYNILSQAEYDSLCETIVVSVRTSKVGIREQKIGRSKSMHPDFVYLGDINFHEKLNMISAKVKNNLKLTNNDELVLMLMCLVPTIKNKADIVAEICKMLKKEHLFDETKIDTFKAVIKLEIDNLISEDERKILKGKMKMSPQTQQAIKDAIKEVGRKYEYIEKQELIEKGKQDGIREGIEKIAKNLKGIHTDEEIAKYTGLDIKTIQKL